MNVVVTIMSVSVGVLEMSGGNATNNRVPAVEKVLLGKD